LWGDLISTIASALEQAEELGSDGWQDISTAPRETPVQVFWRIRNHVCSDEGQAVCALSPGGQWNGGPSQVLGFVVEKWRSLFPPPSPAPAAGGS